MTTRELKYPDLSNISHKHTLDELAEIYGVSGRVVRCACQRRDLMYLPTEYEKMRRATPENELAAASLRLAIATVEYKVKYHGPHWIPVLRQLLGEAA